MCLSVSSIVIPVTSRCSLKRRDKTKLKNNKQSNKKSNGTLFYSPGDVMHSHDYRVPEIFTGKKVLVVGAGPSGMDIALEITSVSPKVILSHHLKEQPRTVFPNNLIQKPDVIKFEGSKAFFQDGTEDDVDVIFLCTGKFLKFCCCF